MEPNEMGVRETINKRKPIAIAVVVLLVATSLGIAYWVARPTNDMTRIMRAYYSDDDGKTYFEDDATKTIPFDHNGKQAVRAYVFRYGSGKPFVEYLGRLNPNSLKRMEQLRAVQPMTPEAQMAINTLAESATQVKKPSQDKWVLMSSPAASAVMNPAPNSSESGDYVSVDPF